ncbi:MAG: ribose ABC transporter permease, partial [Lentisphaeria bacterium]|nr:ribose ABC transporter permease [Lentisphaeria bacterium]
LNSISSTDAGLSYELDAIAGAIIGGTAMNGGRGSIAGTVAGVFILGIISNALDMWGAPVNLQGLVKGLIIIVAVLIQRQSND